MTDAMLEVARRNAPNCGRAYRLQERRVSQRPNPGFGLGSGEARRRTSGAAITDAASFLQADELAQELRVKHPWSEATLSTWWFSNCVLNLVEGKSKRQLFDEIFRVLKKGGRAVISDIVSDERSAGGITERSGAVERLHFGSPYRRMFPVRV